MLYGIGAFLWPNFVQAGAAETKFIIYSRITLEIKIKMIIMIHILNMKLSSGAQHAR